MTRGLETPEGIESLGPLYRIVRRKVGLDLTPYKEKFLRRRLAVRMRATGRDHLSAYLDFLRGAEGEVERLVPCLTIHVSSFFRNPSTFAVIRDRVIPDIFGSLVSNRVRFWSVGCARGEEPYSLAILVCEHLGDSLRRYDVQIHGIDVDERVLREARKATFTRTQVASLAPEMLEKYFETDGPFRLRPGVRRLVRFHRRDIFMEPPEDDYHFILCRNMLIYIEREAQERLLEQFCRSLRPGGYLVLGRTEVLVGPIRDFFEVIDARERVYRRRGPVPARKGAQDGGGE